VFSTASDETGSDQFLSRWHPAAERFHRGVAGDGKYFGWLFHRQYVITITYGALQAFAYCG
jgi:hypothetical protein